MSDQALAAQSAPYPIRATDRKILYPCPEPRAAPSSSSPSTSGFVICEANRPPRLDAWARSKKQRIDATAADATIAEAISYPHPLQQHHNVQAAERHVISSLSGPGTRKTVTPCAVRDLGADFSRYYIPTPTPTVSINSRSRNSSLPQSPRIGCSDRDENAQSSACHGHESGHRFPSPKTCESGHLSGSLSGKDQRGSVFDSRRASAFSDSRSRVDMDLSPTPQELLATGQEKALFFPYLDDRFGAPDAAGQGYNFPMYWDEKEADDELHMPSLDDDRRLRARCGDYLTRNNICSVIGLTAMTIGLLLLFVVLPVLSSANFGSEHATARSWATINDKIYPLMQNIRSGLIDADTPGSALTRIAADGSKLNLVFSDEFNQQNRTFYPGDDPYFYGFDGWYGATEDLEWYDPDAITTWGGTLEIRLDFFENHNLQYRSGMLHSWNQLCLKGGAFEVSVSLPGPAGVHGLWPGVWTMGNLGRPGYLATTDGTWPYTYSQCDAGITPNQSTSDGTSKLPGQKLSSCNCPGSEHPSPGTGRGAPEIDILEASADWSGRSIGVATQSYQVAPFDIWYYPNYDFFENPDPSTSYVNSYTGGPFQQAVSTTSMLNNSWYDGEAYQRYAFEYTPGASEESGVTWFVGDTVTARFDARAIGPNGNVGQRLISEEPMGMVMNLGISNNWVDIDWNGLKFPTMMRIDYVRWYQKEGSEMVTCDPPGFETTEYIAKHAEAYNNPNYTLWNDIYPWPNNTLMHQCT